MRLTATVCVALAASLYLTIEHASAQSCDNYHSLIDPRRIDVTETSAVSSSCSVGVSGSPRAQARTGGVSGATSIVLHCLPDTQCVHTVGGGVKMNLLGPLRLRLDYRVFTLRGSDVRHSKPQRFYAGLNLKF